jgi:ABC-type sulfate transport system substrate-binding protein
MKRTLTAVLPLLAVVAAIALVWFGNIGNDRSIQLLNVSYDPTRELFQDLTDSLFPSGKASDTTSASRP